MNPSLIGRIADAVLYEGYILYPYRPAVKNQRRWTFGGLYPRDYSQAQAGSDPWQMQTECLVRGSQHTTLSVKVRFLHLIARRIGKFDSPRQELAHLEGVHFVESLRVGDRVIQTWQEATEREASFGPWRVADERCARTCTWEKACCSEAIRDEGEDIVGVVVREQHEIVARVQLSAERVGDLFKVRVRIKNRSTLADAENCARDEAVMHSLASTHIVLEAEQGEFLSLIDPPAEARVLAASCRNVGAWPVLVGEPGERRTMLAAPIILYDYPQIAPQSPGDLFDGTEIDEILSLRILTLTDEEKQRAAALDERVRALLQRTETLDRGQFDRLHGVMHPVSPSPDEEATCTK